MPPKHKHNGGLSKRRVLLEKFREETSPLLSTETLGTRISQIDRIIQRKASNALFSLETSNEDSKYSVSRRSHRLERMAEEFLYRVQARRKRARSYCYLLWFLMLFVTFLSTQFLKEDNRNLFTVDKSIKTRVVNILPKGNLNADADFYNWLAATVLDIFKPTICGNGVCEGPDEYPGFGRFGCQEDCGRHFNRTTLRIDLAPVWEAPGGPLAELRGRSVFGAGTSLPVGFSYNVYSETMRDYIFLNSTAERSIIFDVPDGMLRVELYQNYILRTELPVAVIGDLNQVAPETLPDHSFQLPDFQYGDPAEVFATAAALNIQLLDFCQSQGSNFQKICSNASTTPYLGQYLLDNYGLAGSVQLLRGAAGVPQTLASISHCSFSGGVGDSAVFDAARTEPCGWRSAGGELCLNARSLIRSFTCKSTYNLSVWSWGPPRDVIVKPKAEKTSRAVTPFNNLIGGLILTQLRRKASVCPVDPPPQTKALVNTFGCQTDMPGYDGYGMDPTFVVGSPLYAGQLSMDTFYRTNELRNASSSSSRSMSMRRIPFAFFPHQWGNGGLKADSTIHKGHRGVYKIYWDSRLSAVSAKKLLSFVQAAGFLDEFTSSIEVEMVTYNPEFAVFGVATFLFNWDLGGNILWDYQYDTVRLDLYSGGVGQKRLATDIIFGIMLLIDIGREAKDVYDSIMRDKFFTHYCKSVFKYVNWIHYGLILAGTGTWIELNVMSSAITLSSSYPILANLDAPARPFFTIPESEFDLLTLVDKLRNLCQVKNRFAALNVLSTLLFIARVLKILDFQPRMALITRTLRQAGVDLVHFLLLFVVFLGGYSVIATLLLGGQLQEFNGLDTAAVSLFFLCLGWEPKYAPMLAAIETRQSSFAVLSFQLFYWSFISIASFILLNVVLAIIVEAYAVVKRKNMEVKTMGTDLLEISGDTGRRVYNRLFESEVLVSDRKLERILLDATTKRGLRVRKKKYKFSGPSALRLPGGLILTATDLATLLEGSGAKGRSLLRRTSCAHMDKSSLMSSTDTSEVVDSDVEEDFVISRPIQDVINRYEERVDEVKEEHDFLNLIKAESLKRQMTLYPSLELVKHQIEDLKVTMGFLASKLLSKDEKSSLRFEKLIVAAQAHQLDRSVQISELLEISDSLCGELKITVVSAKFFAREDTNDVGEQTAYCVILLEDIAENDDESGGLEVLIRTPSSTLLDSEDRGWHSGTPDIVWNTSYVVSVDARKGSSIVIALVDQHDNSEDVIAGTASIPLSRACVGEETDKWYPLHNTVNGNYDGTLVKLKIKFTVKSHSEVEVLESLNENGMNIKQNRRRSSGNLELQDELGWIQEKLRPAVSSEVKVDSYLTEGDEGDAADSDLLQPLASAATIEVDGSPHQSQHDQEAIQSRASTTSTKGSDALRLDMAKPTKFEPFRALASCQSLTRTQLHQNEDESGALFQESVPEPRFTSRDSPVTEEQASLSLEDSVQVRRDLAARPSIHLDARHAFAFRCSVRARLGMIEKISKEFHPSFGGGSYCTGDQDTQDINVVNISNT